MLTTINGINMNYTGEGRGLPLLFVHGFPLRAAMWTNQVDAFKPDYRVIAPDLCGFGESEARHDAVAMTQYAEDIHTLMRQLATGPAVLIGHSMGGYIALAFAGRYPEALRGLVLVTTKPGADNPDAKAARQETVKKVKAEGPQSVFDSMTPKMLSPDNQDQNMRRRVHDLMGRSKPEGVTGALLGMAARPDSTEMLKNIHVPTLVVTGADDAIIPPAESEKMAKAIKGAALTIVPRAGHLVPYERPAEFNDALRKWLKASF